MAVQHELQNNEQVECMNVQLLRWVYSGSFYDIAFQVIFRGIICSVKTH